MINYRLAIRYVSTLHQKSEKITLVPKHTNNQHVIIWILPQPQANKWSNLLILAWFPISNLKNFKGLNCKGLKRAFSGSLWISKKLCMHHFGWVHPAFTYESTQEGFRWFYTSTVHLLWNYQRDLCEQTIYSVRFQMLNYWHILVQNVARFC